MVHHTVKALTLFFLIISCIAYDFSQFRRHARSIPATYGEQSGAEG